MWQQLQRQRLPPIRLTKSEVFDEFYTPYRPNWSQPVSVNACFTVAFNALVKGRRSWPETPNRCCNWIPAGKNNAEARPKTPRPLVRPCVSSTHHLEASQAVPGIIAAKAAGHSFLQVFTDRFSQNCKSDGDLYSDKAPLLQVVCLFVCVC